MMENLRDELDFACQARVLPKGAPPGVLLTGNIFVCAPLLTTQVSTIKPLGGSVYEYMAVQCKIICSF